jgi:hypothetical protein
MRRLPTITPRTGRVLIALLLGLKLVLLVWNAVSFDRKSLDADYHADRALFGGLRASKTTHDGPLYYLPALLVPRPDATLPARASSGEEGEPGEPSAERAPRLGRSEKAFRAELLDFLRYTNVLWLGLFYVLWIYQVFPRVLSGFRPWFLASLLLLALPGYQRLGVMSHPDNLFLMTASAAIAAWLFVRERWQSGRALRLADLGLFALAVGLMAMTRSFAVVPALVLTVVCVVYAIRSADGNLAQQWPRTLAVLAIVGVLGSSWYLHVRSSAQSAEARHELSYFPKFDQPRVGFDYARYYTSFAARRLLDPEAAPGSSAEASLADSFFTLLYSDSWGDQWSDFSSPRGGASKQWPNRVLLGCALLVPPLLLALGVARLWFWGRRVRADARDASAAPIRVLPLLAELEPELVLLALVVLGGLTFVYWQATLGLFPGDNSTVKFGYVATLFPPALALVFGRELKPATFSLLAAYFLLLYVVAFPVAMYWPG